MPVLNIHNEEVYDGIAMEGECSVSAVLSACVCVRDM